MKIKTYSNNLRLVVNTKKNVDVVSFNIFVNVGAKNEGENEHGYAHFLEHMFFKSTKQTSYKDILKRLDDLGVSNNAYTTMTKTCYYFKCLSGVLEETIALFSEMFFNYDFNPKEMNNERRVILEELKMDEDDQTKKAIVMSFLKMFKNTIYGHEIIGTSKSIKSVTTERLTVFKKRYYLPHNIVISVSGNISFGKINTLIKKYFISKMGQTAINEPEYNQPVNAVNGAQYITKKKDNKQSVVYILTDFGKRSFHERAVLNLYYAVLGYGMSSQLFEILRGKKALVYSIDAGCSTMGDNTISEILFSTTTNNVESALREVRNILRKCADGNISIDELTRAKNKLIASIEYANESNSKISEMNGSDLIANGFIRKDKEVINEILSVTLTDVKNAAIEVLNNNSFVVSGVGNCTNKMLKSFS